MELWLTLGGRRLSVVKATRNGVRLANGEAPTEDVPAGTPAVFGVRVDEIVSECPVTLPLGIAAGSRDVVTDDGFNGHDETIREYRCTFEPQPEGGYTVTVPSLPGCISEGDTLEEARKNIAEAIELWLQEN